MPLPLPPEDEEFLASFEQCSLNKQCWTHEAHLRMAWLQMERAGSFEEALDRIRAGIKSFNTSVQSVGYHETITVAFARLIHHRRETGTPCQNWREFLDLHRDLLSKENPVLHTFYTTEKLSSSAARETFVEPDKMALPAPASSNLER